MSIYNPYYYLYESQDIKSIDVTQHMPLWVSLDEMMEIIKKIKLEFIKKVYKQVVQQYQKEINQWQYEQYRVGGPKYNEAKKEIESLS